LISVCMIVKNEEKNIEKSLKSIQKLGYEIIVVDTGSTDKTKEIVKRYTDKLFNYKWCDDFSLARNFSVSKAKNKYIFILDADEEIIQFDKNEIEETIINNENKIGTIEVINEYKRNGNSFKSISKVSRIFNKDKYKFKGEIHEQLVPLIGKKEEYHDLNIRINHSGYSEEEIKRKDKLNRNIRLLKKELLSKQEDPYILYQLGKTYYLMEDYFQATNYFEKALSIDLDTKLYYVEDLVESYGYSLINSKRYEEALNLLGVYDEFKSYCDFIFLIGMIYMNNGYFKEAINEFTKALNYKECKMVGVNSFLSTYNIGVIYECLGEKELALYYYKKSNNYEKAKDRIKLLNEERL